LQIESGPFRARFSYINYRPKVRRKIMLGLKCNCETTIDNQLLTLVPTTEAHLAQCLEWINDLEISQYLTIRYAKTPKSEKEWYDKVVDDPTTIAWSVMLGETHVGQMGLDRVDMINRTAITGTIISNEFRGKGIAPAASRRRADFAFETLNLVALFTEICAGNQASIKVAEKVGYVYYGTRPYGMYAGGKHHDVWLGCLQRPK
jgi:ribosomal-protein-alanine N-acetyltransferase